MDATSNSLNYALTINQPLKSAEILFITVERSILRFAIISSKNCVEEEKVKSKYVRTEDQLVDLFKKSRGISKVVEFREEIGLVKGKQRSDQGGI